MQRDDLRALFNDNGLAPQEEFLEAIERVFANGGVSFNGDEPEEGSSTLSVQSRRDAQDIFEGRNPNRSPCEHCGGVHARACPRIKREQITYDYNVNTSVTQITGRTVSYWPPGTWETDDIIFPEDVYE